MEDQDTLPGMATMSPEAAAEALVRQDIMHPASDKWPQLLADFVTVTEKALREAGVPAEQSGDLAAAVVLAIGNFVGGKLVYIPRGDRLATALKHARAWRLYHGDNIDEVMAFLGVSQVRAYAVMAEQRRLHRDKVQQKLF